MIVPGTYQIAPGDRHNNAMYNMGNQMWRAAMLGAQQRRSGSGGVNQGRMAKYRPPKQRGLSIFEGQMKLQNMLNAMQPQPNMMAQLIDQYQRQHNQANRANESRYQDILQGYGDRMNRMMALANQGAGQLYNQQNAAVQQDLINRGLRSSTESARGAFDAMERSKQLPLQAYANASADRLGFMERRNDVGPDFNQLAQLAQMAGQTDGMQQFQSQANMIANQLDARSPQMNQQYFPPQAQAAPRGLAPTMLPPQFVGGGYGQMIGPMGMGQNPYFSTRSAGQLFGRPNDAEKKFKRFNTAMVRRGYKQAASDRAANFRNNGYNWINRHYYMPKNEM